MHYIALFVSLTLLFSSDICHAEKNTEIIHLGSGYVDHEILQEENLMVYQGHKDIWLGQLDPKTGLFQSKNGRNILVDQDISSLRTARNGPEFGVDSSGWSIFYNKDVDGRTQVWRAIPKSNSFLKTSLTSGDFDRINQLPSQSHNALSTYVIYGRGDASVFKTGRRSKKSNNHIVWMDENKPSLEKIITKITPQTAGFRWINGTTFFVSTEGQGEHYGQVRLTNAATGQSRIITNDQDIKFDPYGWVAPDYKGDMLLLAATKKSNLAVYRNTGKQYWERMTTLKIPAQSGLKYIQSSEPFTTANKSYIISTIKDNPGPVAQTVKESQIWIYDLSGFALRCDDRKPGRIRHEAEAYLGEDEVFIYYNDYAKGRSIDLYLCRSGLPVE